MSAQKDIRYGGRQLDRIPINDNWSTEIAFGMGDSLIELVCIVE